MKRLIQFNNIIYFIIRAFLIIDIILRTSDNLFRCVIVTGIFVLLLLNDHLRTYGYFKKYYLSIIISMIISSFLVVYLSGYIYIYIFIILYELIMFNNNKIASVLTVIEILFIVSFFGYGFFKNSDISNIQFWKDNLLDIIMIFLVLFFYLINLFFIKILRIQKRKVELLNQEIEKLIITKERNRIAGEIHDNLGHNLVALNIYLDVLENTVKDNNCKTRDLISKIQNLTKDSLDDLRKAVYALKEEDDDDSIELAINKIIDNLNSIGDINIKLNIDKEINIFNKYHNLICNTIKECLTNSMKHGKASEISIDIKVYDGITLIISDNGIGCINLVKGNGLTHIENNIKNNNGTIKYNLDKKGFEIYIYIPN